MTSLSVWTFASEEGAEPARRTLGRMEMQRHVAVDDVSVVSWPAGNLRPLTYQAGSATGAAELCGAFWGLLFGLVFLLPLAGLPRDPTDETFGLAPVGVPDGLLRQIRQRVVPGTSALFLLTPDSALERIGRAVTGSRAEPLVTTFTDEQETALRRAFATEEGPEPTPV